MVSVVVTIFQMSTQYRLHLHQLKQELARVENLLRPNASEFVQKHNLLGLTRNYKVHCIVNLWQVFNMFLLKNQLAPGNLVKYIIRIGFSLVISLGFIMVLSTAGAKF